MDLAREIKIRKIAEIAFNRLGFRIVRQRRAGAASAVPTREIFPKLLPEEMSNIVRSYEGSTPTERSEISRALLAQIIANPEYGSFLFTKYFEKSFGGEEIYLQAIGAHRFANGDVESATKIFKDILKQNLNTFNFQSLARCYMALGKEEQALKPLEEALAQYPRDFTLAMELATTNFRLGRTKLANDYLFTVREKYSGQQRETLDLSNEIDSAVSKKLLYRVASGDVYDDAFVKYNWWHYWKMFNSQNRFQDGTPYVGHILKKYLSSLIRKEKDRISHCIDFGVFCAYPNFELALEFPDVKFIGVDRQKIIKELNDIAFPAPNFESIAGDIVDVLPKVLEKGSETILFHARTAVLCYPEYLVQFYKQCRSLGIRHIVMYESIALSRQHLKFFDYSDMPAISIANRSIMFHHNYREILGNAGYKVVTEDRVSPSYLLEDGTGLGDVNIVIVAQLNK